MALNFLLKRTATASKRPVAASVSLGELNIDYDTNTFGLFAKNSAGTITKIGPVEVGTTAPNATPVGSSGNSRGELWYDSTNGLLKTYNGTSFVNPVPNGSTTVVGILQLTDSTSSTSTTTAATPNSVKSAYDLANAAIAKSIVTAKGDLIVATASATVAALPTGTNGQSLVVDTACATGLKWGQSLAGYTCSATPFNTAVGGFAGDSITTGACNTLFGYNAGTILTGGLNNTFIGFSAGDGYLSADNSTAVGSNALGNSGGNNNTAVGFCAGGGFSSGGNNTMVGTCAGRNATTADNTTALGFNALSSTHSGNGTVALGACALAVSTSGGCNTAVGCNAGLATTTGALNTLVGFSAGSAITTGGSNTLVGRYAGTTALANNVVLSDGAGTIRFQANSTGAISFDGTNFGTAGQTLQSNGTAAVPTWVTPIWQNLTTLTLTSTTLTTLLSVSAAAFRGGIINVSVSDATSGKFHTDTLQFVVDGGSTNLQVIGGAHIGSAPYTASVAEVGGNIVVSVTSASTNSTKYVGNYMTFAI